MGAWVQPRRFVSVTIQRDKRVGQFTSFIQSIDGNVRMWKKGCRDTQMTFVESKMKWQVSIHSCLVRINITDQRVRLQRSLDAHCQSKGTLWPQQAEEKQGHIFFLPKGLVWTTKLRKMYWWQKRHVLVWFGVCVCWIARKDCAFRKKQPSRWSRAPRRNLGEVLGKGRGDENGVVKRQRDHNNEWGLIRVRIKKKRTKENMSQ